MKKIIAILLVAVMLAACSKEPEKPAINTETLDTTEESKAESSSPPKTRTTTETELSKEPVEVLTSEEEIDPYSPYGPDGKKLSLSDGVEGEYSVKFPFAYYYISSGLSDDSEKNPKDFNVGEYLYSGNFAGVSRSDYKTIKSGDKIAGLEVIEGVMEFMKIPDESGENIYAPFCNSVTLSGEKTFEGYLEYFDEDEYGVANGDITFTPYPSELGDFPLANVDTMGTLIFNQKANFGFCGDTVRFICGNIFTDYKDSENISEPARKSALQKAKVTLTDIRVEWSDQFGFSHSMATIKDINIIG